MVAFCLFWAYSKLIYHKEVPDKRQLMTSHLMFCALNTIFYRLPSFNLPYWVIVPLLLNSTRIELWWESLMIHANNLVYAQMKTLKNAIFMVCLFHCADKYNFNASFVVNILAMDMIHFMLHIFKRHSSWHHPKLILRSSYLTIRTISVAQSQA